MHPRRLILFAAVTTLCMIVVMVKTGAPLTTNSTPAGILHLEFAYTAEKVQGILSAWSAIPHNKSIHPASLNTWLDFLFILSYSLLLFHLSRWIAVKHVRFDVVGKWMAIASILAGVLDVLENIGMLISLSGNISDITSKVTCICAVLKWVIVIPVAFLVMLGSVMTWIRRPRELDPNHPK